MIHYCNCFISDKSPCTCPKQVVRMTRSEYEKRKSESCFRATHGGLYVGEIIPFWCDLEIIEDSDD